MTLNVPKYTLSAFELPQKDIMSSNMKIKKACEHCGLEFIARNTVTKYCGDHCGKRAYIAKVRDQKIKDSQVKADRPSAHVIRKENENDKSYFALKTIDYLTVSEAAVLLKCGRRTIYRMIKASKIPSANLSIKSGIISPLFFVNLRG